jgi:hypothetical protein
MARCPTAKLFPFAAPLLGAGDETSGDDEASVVALIVGHAFRGAWGRVEMLVDLVHDGAKKKRKAT